MLMDDDLADVKITVDRIRIEQAVANLLENAIHAYENRVKVSWATDSERVMIAIEDDGEGISRKDRPYVFNPFFTTKPVGQGTGLGLSVAHAAVSDHGGDIIIEESTTLGGACFHIILE